MVELKRKSRLIFHITESSEAVKKHVCDEDDDEAQQNVSNRGPPRE